MSKIICIGSACKDIFFPTNEGKITETPENLASKSQISFELGAKFRIEERFEAIGGCAANVAVGLAKLGVFSACYSHIGDDLVSDWVKKELKKNGVDTSLISQEKKCPSDMSAIVVDAPSGERIIFSNQKANGKLEIEPEKIKDYEWFFVGDLHGRWENDLDIIFRTAKENKIKIAYNPRQSNIHDNAGYIAQKIGECELVFLNKDESIEIVSNFDDPFKKEELDSEKFLLEKLKSLGAKIVTITDGKRGAWTTDGEKIFFVKGLEVGAHDSTGAGDAYASAFLAAYLKGKGIDECAQWGIAASSNVVKFYGAIRGLLDENEIAASIKEKNIEAEEIK